MNVLVTGGCGYVGAWLVPLLLGDGHKVTVLDAMLLGDGGLPKENGSLTVIKGDVSELEDVHSVCKNQEAVIHLASISADAMCQRFPVMSSEINVFGTFLLAREASRSGVSRFIYASSVAVYGGADAREDSPLAPTTPYAEQKVQAESDIQKYQPNAVIVRAASVCGYSPRMRFDLMVNRMVRDAICKGVITIHGGSQTRCHIHIADLCDFYRMLVRDDFPAGPINVSAANLSVAETAELVASHIKGVAIEVKPRTDDRSYSVNTERMQKVFSPTRWVGQAILDIKWKFESNYWRDAMTNPVYQNEI